MQTKDIDESETQYIAFRNKKTQSDVSEERTRKIRDYLDFYYERRQKTAKCYTKLCFTADACSTQQAESLNATVKRFIKIARQNIFGS